ncbi:porin family protein [Gillisia sp. Hel_I_86]|uniref:porin family protein n=1 Tax=Gillisia sp. Hel_I_86 TaxID=1249981 RepID=UPI00119CFE81|nr:porin family protein [Gillisia sp. Hel_I_86]
MNFANLNGNAENVDIRTSFHLGLVVEIPVEESFYFAPEVLYSSQGAKFSDEGFDGNFKLDYIQIPLVARYYVSNGFSLEAGPQIGFLTSSEVELEDMGVDGKDFFSGFDYGVNFG